MCNNRIFRCISADNSNKIKRSFWKYHKIRDNKQKTFSPFALWNVYFYILHKCWTTQYTLSIPNPLNRIARCRFRLYYKSSKGTFSWWILFEEKEHTCNYFSALQYAPLNLKAPNSTCKFLMQCYSLQKNEPVKFYCGWNYVYIKSLRSYRSWNCTRDENV